MKKKLTIIGLVVLMLLSLVGCADVSDPSGDSSMVSDVSETFSSQIPSQSSSEPDVPDVSPQNQELRMKIINLEVENGAERKDIEVDFVEEKKICNVAITIKNLGVITNNLHEPKNRQNWSEYITFQKSHYIDLAKIVEETSGSDWSIILTTVDQNDKVHLMVEKGEVIYNIADK